MPPKYYITFVNGNIEITFSIYCTKENLVSLGLRRLREEVINPLDYKIKI